jgi:hypothetical protein
MTQKNRTVQQLADDLSLIGRNGFLICNSYKDCSAVEIRFGTLKEGQKFHVALHALINRPECKAAERK